MVIGRDGFKKIEILGTSGQPIVSASEIVIDAGRMILKGNNFKLIPHQMEVDGVAYMADGIVPFKALVTLSTNQQVNLEVLGASSKEDRRASLKVPTDAVEMVLEVRSTGNSNSHYMNVEDEIQLLNLSMNGVGFMSNRPYFKHQKLTIQMCYIRQDFLIVAEVLRKTRLKQSYDQKYKYSYGCKFHCNDELKNRMLVEHVFKLEMLNRQAEEEKVAAKNRRGYY